jgi:hypothetical protein
MLPGPAVWGVHAATNVGPVLLVEHVVAVQALPAPAADGVQVATGTFVVVTVLHAIVSHAFPLLPV